MLRKRDILTNDDRGIGAVAIRSHNPISGLGAPVIKYFYLCQVNVLILPYSL
jgi:hypothetical protein